MIALLKDLLDRRHGTNCRKAEQGTGQAGGTHELVVAAREVRDTIKIFAAIMIRHALEHDPHWLRRWHELAQRLNESEQIERIERALRDETGAIYPTSSCDELRAIHWRYVLAQVNAAAACEMAGSWPEPDDEWKE